MSATPALAETGCGCHSQQVPVPMGRSWHRSGVPDACWLTATPACRKGVGFKLWVQTAKKAIMP
jgi:hypothetical protein